MINSIYFFMLMTLYFRLFGFPIFSLYNIEGEGFFNKLLFCIPRTIVHYLLVFVVSFVFVVPIFLSLYLLFISIKGSKNYEYCAITGAYKLKTYTLFDKLKLCLKFALIIACFVFDVWFMYRFNVVFYLKDLMRLVFTLISFAFPIAVYNCSSYSTKYLTSTVTFLVVWLFYYFFGIANFCFRMTTCLDFL